MDRTGTAILLFTERDFPATSPLRTVEVAERPAGSVAVSAPLVLSVPGSTEPALAVAPDGRAVAAWIGPDHAVWAASRDPATAWQPAVRISGPGPARGVAVAIGELGDAAVSWFERAPMVALRARDGSWSPAEAVATAAPLPPGAPTAVAIAPLGDAVAVAWRESPAPLTLKVAWRADPARPWRVSPIARAAGQPQRRAAEAGDGALGGRPGAVDAPARGRLADPRAPRSARGPSGSGGARLDGLGPTALPVGGHRHGRHDHGRLGRAAALVPPRDAAVRRLHPAGHPSMTDTPPDSPPTLYEWAGGRPGLERMLDAFDDRVEGDDLIAPLFPGGVGAEHRRNVTTWWCEVFGGPADRP